MNSEKLHNRIEDIMHEKIRTKLLAIKWLGNLGAHFNAESLDKDDILYAFAMIQSILEELYSTHEKDLDIKAKEINTKHENKGKK